MAARARRTRSNFSINPAAKFHGTRSAIGARHLIGHPSRSACSRAQRSRRRSPSLRACDLRSVVSRRMYRARALNFDSLSLRRDCVALGCKSATPNFLSTSHARRSETEREKRPRRREGGGRRRWWGTTRVVIQHGDLDSIAAGKCARARARIGISSET